MTGQRIGYIRVSALDQNDADRIFSDKASGKDVQRPQLEALMDFVREGDTVQRGAYKGSRTQGACGRRPKKGPGCT